MIESVVFHSKTQKTIPIAITVQNRKLIIDVLALSIDYSSSFDIIITFKQAITEFRNHDYTWVKVDKDRIATRFSPKIIKLATGLFVQPNVNHGIWEVKRKNPKILYWRFNAENDSPLAVYTGAKCEKTIRQANDKLVFFENIALLFSKQNAVEFSRSIFPFSAVACFTDHCDFDTASNVAIQRDFFKANKIKVTKGFFLNHFSKRNDNASFENNEEEFEKWRADGHELAYHSLSQSLKSKSESEADFFSFVPPYKDITTWIDHGYQPYNLSLYQNTGIDEKKFATTLEAKNINILWNYIDTGTATLGVINQLNSSDFTLARFSEGIKQFAFSDRLGILIKNIMFHYYADEKMIYKYQSLAANFKQLFHEKKGLVIFKFIKNAFSIIIPILKLFLFWKLFKNKPYKLAKYSPLVFRHTINGKAFYVFQTIEMIDFKKSLHPDNIDKLIEEKGIFIAHTYFSVPLLYHKGRMFASEAQIDAEVAQNFNYLATKISGKQVWNPTLNELVRFLTNFENIVLGVDDDGAIQVVHAASVPYRILN